MPAVTTQVFEVEGVKIAIPVSEIKKPSPECERLFNEHKNPVNWKRPVEPFFTKNEKIATEYADCLNFYCGGSELDFSVTKFGVIFQVKSMGYYHYVGS